MNVILLGGYTFGCHSLRHLVGGRNDCITESPTCHKLYKGCSALNKRHMLWAWMSLVLGHVRGRLRAAVLDGRVEGHADHLIL